MCNCGCGNRRNPHTISIYRIHGVFGGVNRHTRSLQWCLIFVRFQCTQRVASSELIEQIAKITVIVAESVFRLFPFLSVNADKAHDGPGPGMNVLHPLLFRIACVYLQLHRNRMQNILRDDK